MCRACCLAPMPDASRVFRQPTPVTRHYFDQYRSRTAQPTDTRDRGPEVGTYRQSLGQQLATPYEPVETAAFCTRFESQQIRPSESPPVDLRKSSDTYEPRDHN